MDNRSRGKRHLPKGLPLDLEPKELNKRDIVRANSVNSQGASPNKWSKKHFTASATKDCLICGAYSEPLGFDMIESILMQRDFIID